MPHDYAKSPQEAVADTLKAGTDLNCGTYYQTHLPQAFSQGLYDESVLDTALTRLFSAQIKLGYFDPASATPYRSLSFSDIATPPSLALTRQAAVSGMTLLKNDGTLPLNLKKSSGGSSSKPLTIALIGQWANATTQMQGNYAGIAKYLHSPFYSFQTLSPKQSTKILYAQGVSGQGDPTTDSWASTLSTASSADILIVCDGISDSDESEGMDRYSIDWTGAQIDLLTELAATGKPTVLVQFGDQLDDTPFLNNPNISAIVWAGYPGQSGGDAVFDVLTGAAAPAGRLPVTQYPASYVQQVAMTDMGLKPNKTSGNPGRTYQFYPQESAILPFGYGLHYTNFSTKITGVSPAGRSSTMMSNGGNGMTNLNISSIASSCDRSAHPYLDTCPLGSVSVAVSNTGKVTSDHVVLLFAMSSSSSSTTTTTTTFPTKKLIAYTRLHSLAAGSKTTTTLNLTMASLASYDAQGDAVVMPGMYDLVVDVPEKDRVGVEIVGAGDGGTVVEMWPRRP